MSARERAALALGPLRRGVVRRLLRWGWHLPIALLFERRILAASAGGLTSGTTVLALNVGRFRKDLDLLERTGRFRVLRVPFATQAALIPYFYGSERNADTVFRPAPGSPGASAQADYRRLLETVIRRLVERHDVKVVLGAAIHYLQDLDWGAAGREAGVPYVVLHRENLVTAPASKAAYAERYAAIGPFQGDHIAVHNSFMRGILVESGFATREQVSVVGAMRMDGYIRRVAATFPVRHNRLTLFSFHHAAGLGLDRHERIGSFRGVWAADGQAGYVRMFDAVHGAVARVAARRPDIEVVIKPKWGGESWIGHVVEAVRRVGLDEARLPNLRIDAEIDAQDLILSSDVISGFGSTALLEGALAGRPVVVPHFEEAAELKYEGRVPFLDAWRAFDVARSADEYERLLEARLDDPSVDEETMAFRRDVFDSHISPIDAGATERYVRLLEDWARRGPAPRGGPRAEG